MKESEGNLSREINLYNNPHQTVIRNTADFLDKLQDAPWLTDRDSARYYIGKKSISFVRSAREEFHRLPGIPKRIDELNLTLGLAKQIPHVPTTPAQVIVEGFKNPAPPDPLGFTLVILAHMSGDEHAVPGFTKPETPAEVLAYLAKLEKSLLDVAMDRTDPARASEDPSYLRMKRFFTIGRRIPIKAFESENESREKAEYDLNKYLGFTN